MNTSWVNLNDLEYTSGLKLKGQYKFNVETNYRRKDIAKAWSGLYMWRCAGAFQLYYKFVFEILNKV